MEDRAIERQIVRDAVTAKAAEERNGPVIHWADTDSGGRIETVAQARSTQCVHEIPADLSIDAGAHAGEVRPDACCSHRNDSPFGRSAHVPGSGQVRDGVADIDDR